ncbi:MAG: GNAT family N-acetyltransferase [Gaiellaceae bacterium]
MLVRLAREHEIDTIADIYVASFRGLTFLPRLHSDEEMRDWVRRVMAPGHEVSVGEMDGRLVGFASLRDGLLGHFYVHPDAQGRGVGSALLENVKLERPEGFELWVFQRNDRARRFYERHGCRLIELTDGSDNEECEPDARYEWRP